MIESREQQQLLFALMAAKKQKAPGTIETLRQFGENLFNDKLMEWDIAITDLKAMELIDETDGVFSLTEKGREAGEAVAELEMAQRFSQMLISCESSEACSEFNRRLHGYDLCQFNMMSMDQLQQMLDGLDLKPGDTVLDVGCGIGTVTEHISDVTSANVTGLDFAAGAINRAMERTQSKRDRLSFTVGNMDALDFPDSHFDAILAIDTLYFSSDVEAVLKAFKRMLRDTGSVGVFWSQYAGKDQDHEVLKPTNTRLAQAAERVGFQYRYWEYSDTESAYWKRTLTLAEELRDAFEAEGNLHIYQGRINEAQSILKRIESGGISRFYYQLEPIHTP